MTPREQLDTLRKGYGITKIENAIALAKDNDPFAIGAANHISSAKWFSEIYHSGTYTGTAHLRRIHYRLVSQREPVMRPNGDVYENTEKDWAWLTMAAKWARYLGYLDYNLFEDKRAAPTQPYDVIYTEIPESHVSASSIEELNTEMPTLPRLSTYTGSFSDIADPYQIEIWCEKSSVNDVLIPLCKSLRVNYVHGKGELSITLADEVVARAEESGKPVRILYVSDFDPAGLSMPVAISRKIEFMTQDVDMDIQLFPVLLTQEQCIEYELPRTPMKKGERRAKGFEKLFGKGATELDALEELYPGVLRKILSDIIKHYRDSDYLSEVRSRRRDFMHNLRDLTIDVHNAHGMEEARTAWHAMQLQMEEWKEKYEEAYQRIEDDLADIEVDEFELPEAPVIESHAEPLFDTSREYMEQLAYYKSFQNR